MLRKVIVFIISLFLFFSITVKSDAEDNISASSAVVIDAATKTVLYEKNAHYERAMASTTKIMTALIACESGRLGETVTISEDMLKNTEGSSIYLKAGDAVTLYDLVLGAMIASGNDASNAIAVYLCGSLDAFLEHMNNKAQEIGMKNTVFETPSGLDRNNHRSTAYDMALLGAYAMENPDFSRVCALKSADITVSGKTQTLYNHNKLLSRSEHFSGIKTGYTIKAGRCLVSSYEYKCSRIICVTLNAPDDWHDHAVLIKEAKTRYNNITENRTIEINAVGSEKQTVCARYDYALAAIGVISEKLYYYPFIYAPVNEGDIIGTAEIYCENKLVLTVNIFASENIERLTEV